MWCNQLFSLLSPMDEQEDSYVVANVIVCDHHETATQIAKLTYGENAIAIDTTYFPVVIGNICVDGKFYDENGNEVVKNPTEAEEIQNLRTAVKYQESQIDSLTQYNADLLYQISLMQMGITDIEE